MAKRKAPDLGADKSEWVLYAMRVHDLPSYDAWAMELDELQALAPAFAVDVVEFGQGDPPDVEITKFGEGDPPDVEFDTTDDDTEA